MSKYYPLVDGHALDVARLKLALFDERTVRDIIALVNLRGDNLISDIFNQPGSDDPPRVLGVLSPEYIEYRDQPSIIVGVATLLTAALRKPSSRDDYAQIITDATGVPKPMANAYADKIETLDKIESSGNLLSNTSGTLAAWKDRADEWVRGMANRIADAAGASTLFYWDQDQDRDIDYLFELSRLGDVMLELGKRRRLIGGQAGVAAQLELLQTGDIADEDLESEAEAAALGDIVRRMSLNRIPAQAGLPNSTLAHRIDKQLLGDIAQVTGASSPEEAASPQSMAILKDKVEANSGKKGFLANLLGIAFPRLAALRGAMMTGDSAILSRDKALEEVAHAYGPRIATQMMMGDVEGIVGDAMKLAMHEDPDTWGDVDQIAMESIDPDDDMSNDPEVGGLFSKWRARASAKKLARQTRRAERKAARFDARQTRRDTHLANKIARKSLVPQYAGSGMFGPQVQAPIQYQDPGYQDDMAYDPNYSDSYDDLYPDENFMFF